MKDERTILIEEIVRRLDRYLFNFEVAVCALNGDQIVRPQEDDDYSMDNPVYTTQRQKAANHLSCDIEQEISQALPEDKRSMVSRLDAAHIEYVMASEDVARLLGLVMGLRLAGLSSDETKRIARTWTWDTGIPESQIVTEHDGEDSRAH